MATHEPIPLSPSRTFPGEVEFLALLGWPFAQETFFEAQVKRLLESDVPQRVLYGSAIVWLYRDPAGNAVGFGKLDVCREYSSFTQGTEHCYIPLLAVNPAFQKRGHGQSIVQHLIAEAALIVRGPRDISDVLFLDVYTANGGAIALYEKCGFVNLNPSEPILDPEEGNQPYVVMGTRVSISGV